MSEIRKHYFLFDHCIIAEERNNRPSDFENASRSLVKNSSVSCPFCEGSEESTPLATAVYKNGEIFTDTLENRIRNWDFRCFLNAYPALSPVLYPSGGHQEVGLHAEPGYGFHEIIVETPLHGRRIEDFSCFELSGLMNVYKDRICNYMTYKKIRYVSIFKNIGKSAGASINHSHSQLIALPFCPPSLEKEMKAIKERDNCPYCAIFDLEKASPRFILENSECIAFAPYFSIAPFEVWILPKRHVSFLGDCKDKLLFALGDMLQAVLRSYGRVFENLPLNFMFYQLFDSPEYHLNIRLLPKLSINAGFELNTGTYINTVSPENAASCLRGDFMHSGLIPYILNKSRINTDENK